MTNIEIIRKVNEGFAEGDTEKIMQYMADDIKYDVIGTSTLINKKVFRKEINNKHFVGLPTIKINNEIERGNWIAVEGELRCKKSDGGLLDAYFFDMYRLENGKIREMRSYVIERNESFIKSNSILSNN